MAALGAAPPRGPGVPRRPGVPRPGRPPPGFCFSTQVPSGTRAPDPLGSALSALPAHPELPFRLPLPSCHLALARLPAAGPHPGFARTPCSCRLHLFACPTCRLSQTQELWCPELSSLGSQSFLRNLMLQSGAPGTKWPLLDHRESLFDLPCRSSKLHLSPKADVKNLVAYMVTKTRAINGSYHRFLGRHFPRFYALYTVFMKGKH